MQETSLERWEEIPLYYGKRMMNEWKWRNWQQKALNSSIVIEWWMNGTSEETMNAKKF